MKQEKEILSYNKAVEKSLGVRWKVDQCAEGQSCWCRIIRCEEPIWFRDGDMIEEYWVVRSGELNRETVEHMVEIHNGSLEQETK